MGEEQTDTELVLAARNDDPAAFGQLFDRWFNRTWNVARTILRDDDLAADVAQDTMVKAWQQLDQLEDPDAFGGWLLRSTRNRALNRLAREGRSRASGDDVVSGLRDRGAEDPVGAERLPEPDLVNEIRDRQELVWAAATALGERDASLLDLHLRHGLSPAEIAEELGVEANAAHQQLFRLRNRLGDAIGSYLLWRNGRPLCDGLADAVSGRTAFDRSVAKSVARHQASCEHCSEERESLVDPSKLFAAVPLLLVPPHLKAEAAAALQSVGVPTDGSASAADASANGAESAGSDGGSTSGSGGSGGGESASSSPGADGGGAGGTGDQSGSGSPGADASPGGSGGGGSAPEGIRLDLGSAPGPTPAPVGAAGPSSGSGFALANEAVGAGPGPTILAPVKAISRARAMALAGAGVVAVAALIGLGAFVLRDGDASDNVAAIASTDGDDPNPPGGDQGAAGDEGDPAGPASFAPSSDTSAPSSSTSASADDPTTSRESTTRPATTRESTTETTETTVTTPDPDPDPDPTPSVTPTVTVTQPDPTPSVTRTVTVTQPDPTPSVTRTVTITVTQPDPTPSVTDPIDPPLVIRFDSRISRTSLVCLRGQLTYEAIWFTEFADSVTLSLPGSSPRVAASGSLAFCGNAGARIGITARNAGGEASDSTTL